MDRPAPQDFPIRPSVGDPRLLEDELLLSKTFAENLIFSSLDGILAFDLNNNYIVWNPAMEQITGLKKHQIVGKNCFAVFPFLKAVGAETFHRDALLGETTKVPEFQYHIPESGKMGWMEAVYGPLFDSHKKIIGGFGFIRDISERKRAEETLLLSKEILDQLPIAVVVCDSENRIQKYIAKAEQIFGYAEKEVLGKRPDFLLEDLKEGVLMENIQKSLSETGSFFGEIPSIRKDGKKIQLEISIKAVSDSAGKVKQTFALGFDVTDRHQQQIGATRQRVLYEALLKAQSDMGEGVLVFDSIEKKIIHFNDALIRIFGSPDEKIDKQTLYSFVEENELDQEIENSFEIDFRKKTGEQIFIEVSVRTAEDSKFRVALVRDITKRKRAEAALVMSEEQNRNIIENATDIISVISPAGLVVSLNQAFEKTTGFKTWEWIGQSFVSLIHPEDFASGSSGFQRALRESKNILTQFRMLTRSGTYVPVESRNTVLYKEGEITGVLVITRDMSDKRKVQEEREKRQELERSNRELEQFAYICSHDLQEPLRMVTSYVQLLEKKYGSQLDSEAKDFIGFAVTGARRMHDLIKDLLTYSRIESAVGFTDDVDTQKTVEQVWKSLNSEYSQIQASLVAKDLPSIKGNRALITQLIQNLITNCIRFRGPVSLDIQVRATREEHAWLFEISDNGIGFDPKYSEYIFSVFKQLHAREQFGGTGIGLAVCRRIVERHKGRIWATSSINEGAKFFFTIPLN